MHTVKREMYQPTLAGFNDWLKDKTQADERMRNITANKTKPDDPPKNRATPKSFAASSKGVKPADSPPPIFEPCISCKGKHPLWKCKDFLAKTPTQREKLVGDNKI